MGAPDAQAFFATPSQAQGAPEPLPSASEFFGTRDPQAGAGMDAFWSSAQHSGARILDAFGQGIKDGWGSKPLGLSDHATGELRKAGIFNDWSKGEEGFWKGTNETLIRGAAAFADAVPRALSSATEAVRASTAKTAEEVQGTPEQETPLRKALALPFGVASEYAEDIATGAIPEAGALGIAERGGGLSRAAGAADSERVVGANRARSLGVVGEGEAGFYEATPPTPENAAARQSAAQDIGEPMAPPAAPAPDIHALARRVDPETFRQYDALALERDQWRTEVARLGDERAASPKVAEAQAQIDTIMGKVHGVEERLTKAGAERLSAAQARLDDALKTDTPEMAEARSKLMQADFAMRDLAPDVSGAYRQASDMLPEAVPGATEAPRGTPGGAQAAEAAKPASEPPERPGEGLQAHPVPTGVIEGGVEAAETAPPQVLGGETLGEPGKPLSFKTAKGSTYEIHDDGTTTRNKAPRPDAGHEGDQGLKPRSTKTVYVDTPDRASSLSAAGLNGLGPKGARVVIRDGKASLLTWNEKEGRWGRSLSGTDVPVSDVPAVGKAPLELWDPKEDVQGHQAYGNMHAGNAITEIETPAPVATGPRVSGAGAARSRDYAGLKPIEGTGETRERGLSAGIEAKAVEDGLTQTFGDLPEYQTLSMAEQAEAATKLATDDYERAKSVAMGERAAPKGVLPESVFVAVEKRALGEGDVETLRQLATRSKLSSAATTMGQRIRTLGERDKASPLGAIQEVQKAREVEAAKGVDTVAAKRETAEEIRAEVRKAATTKADAWNDFVASIRCES